MKRLNFSKIWLTLAYFLISIAFLEIGLRVIKPQPVYSKLTDFVGNYFKPDKLITWTLRPGYQGSEPSMDREGERVVVTINQDGFRGEEINQSKSNIVIIGDSYTFGVYVNDWETYPYILNKLVKNKQRNLQVINAGYVGGFETDQQYAWASNNLKKLNPSVVILSVFAGNDILGIRKAAWQVKNDRGFPTQWHDKNYYVHSSGIITKKDSIGRSFLERLYEREFLRESHLLVAVSRLAYKYFAKQNIDENGYDYMFGIYSDEFREKEKTFLALINEFNSLVRATGAKFIVMMVPINFQIEPEKKNLFFGHLDIPDHLESVYYRRLGKKLASLDIKSIDLETLMLESQEGPFFPSNGEPHFNSNGHNFTAKIIYNYLVERKLIFN